MRVKVVRNIIIAILCGLSAFIVYCTTQNKEQIQYNKEAINKETSKQESKTAINNLQHNNQNTIQNINQSAINTETQKSTESPQETKKTDQKLQIKDNTIKKETNIQKEIQKSEDNKKPQNTHKTQAEKIEHKQAKTTKKQDDKKEISKTKTSNGTKNTLKDTQQKNTESSKDSKQNEHFNNMKTLTQDKNDDLDSKDSKKNEGSNENNTDTSKDNENNKTKTTEKNKDNKAIKDNESSDNTTSKEQDIQNKNNAISNKAGNENNNKKENKYLNNANKNQESNEYKESNEESKQTETNKQTNTCTIAPSCNSAIISRQLAMSSLDLHASVRAKEEASVKGELAGEDFMRLWQKTRNIILPKLTSHVSNIQDKGIQENKQIRTCMANYYTEVLEDFGHGWKDKKGDKSPVYSVKYSISCKNSDTAKLTIIEESKQSGDTKKTLILQDNKEIKESRMPPACDANDVYNQLAQAGLYAHAYARAQEEGRTRGQVAQQKFMNLWDKTQSQIIAKLTSHVSNIQDKGIQENKQIRTCMANYYTEVLEDFGHGWKDKKGDKSPVYIVYYQVSYANNEDDVIKIKITAQNRIK